MKIVLAHNSYQFRGGEDQVFEDERWLLKKNGHEVVSYCRDNSETDSSRRFGLAMKTVWSRQSYNELMSLLQAERPDLIHFHNTFPLVSPSAYYAAKRLGIPVVQTLHNYRLACPGAVMLQGGEICDACVGKRFAWNAVRHRCYRNSTAASLVTTAMLATHWSWRTWQDVVTKYIALTEFGRQTMVRAGISDDQIHVKPNFVRPDPGMGTGDGDYAIFVGRLSEEKGIDVLLDAWRDESLPRLKIVGEGPLEDLVHQAIREGAKIEYINQQPHDRVFSLIARSRFLVFPSIWNEAFGRCMVEAFATGTPVIATDILPMNSIVSDERTGLLFRRGDAADLKKQVKRLLADEPARQRMRQAARHEFENKYTAAGNMQMLLGIYEAAIAAVKSSAA